MLRLACALAIAHHPWLACRLPRVVPHLLRGPATGEVSTGAEPSDATEAFLVDNAVDVVLAKAKSEGFLQHRRICNCWYAGAT